MYGVLFTVAVVEPAWFLSIFSPTWAALLISYVIGGQDEVKRLLSGYLRRKVGLRWYLATLFLFLGPLGIGLVYIALGNPYPGINPGLTLMGVSGQLFLNVFSGPLLMTALVLIFIFFGPKHFSRKPVSELLFQKSHIAHS